MSPEPMVIKSTPYSDQRPGTSGLRKKTRVFAQPHYLANFVQAVLDVLRQEPGLDLSNRPLVVGGDGRYWNRPAIQIIIRVAAANGFRQIAVGRGGLLSTPAASAVIRAQSAVGAFVLSASHNPGGVDEDFGIKFNTANGAPAPQSFTEAVYAQTKRLDSYRQLDTADIDIEQLGETQLGETVVRVFDPLSDYVALLQRLFDFSALERLLGSGFRLCFDAMNAVTGPYAHRIFEEILGAPAGTVIRGRPLEDFGGVHPDPNLKYAAELVALMNGPQAADLGAASDGDGDRNLILGRNFFVTPGDSLAVIAEQAAACIPGYAGGLAGLARSMPTSQAADRVAAALGIPCFETPTGWKFFCSLMDAGRCTICGEESFGTGSNHVREKDGLWAVLAWLSLLAKSGQPVAELVNDHWRRFGRSYYQRHDFEGLASAPAEAMLAKAEGCLAQLVGSAWLGERIVKADNFDYSDPISGEVAAGQGLRVIGSGSSRVIFRLSGTGTEGATLRVYLERFDPKEIAAAVSEKVAPLLEWTLDFLELERHCGVRAATVVT